MRMKQKKIFFEEKKSKIADFSKSPFFKIANSRELLKVFGPIFSATNKKKNEFDLEVSRSF